MTRSRLLLLALATALVLVTASATVFAAWDPMNELVQSDENQPGAALVTPDVQVDEIVTKVLIYSPALELIPTTVTQSAPQQFDIDGPTLSEVATVTTIDPALLTGQDKIAADLFTSLQTVISK